MPYEPSPEERTKLERLKGLFDASSKRRAHHESRWTHFYRLYRGFTDWKQQLSTASDRERGGLILDGKREWGAELFIPMSFSIVETIVPRMLAHSPKMLALPTDDEYEENVQNVEYLLNRQQEQIDYELTLQDVAKSGLIYGLGVQKTFWRKEFRRRRKLNVMTVPQEGKDGELQEWAQGDLQRVCVFDDPDAECIDLWDFFWDPFADSLKNCDYIFHRSWRSTKYVKERMAEGSWKEIDPNDLERMASRQAYADKWSGRWEAQGQPGDSTLDKGDVHEVWEFHDRDKVCTVLDREAIVQEGGNPAWHGEFPFQIYRPTKVLHEFAGIGEVEPVEDLQQELNTLRSQRRDNATLVLQKVFAYYDGLVDPNDLKFGAGIGIPVNGNPQELLFPIPVGDIPHSGYAEEDRLLSDFDRTSGVSDPVAGGESKPGTTATEVQLVQQAASIRIQLKAKRIHKEVIRPAAKQFVALDQQKIVSNRKVRIPAPPIPGEAEQRWAWRQVGPQELAGEFEIVPEGGTHPENPLEQQQKAMQFMQAFGQNPLVDQRMVMKTALRLMGIDQPEGWLAPPEPQVPVSVLDSIVQIGAQAGAPPELMQQVIAQALEQVDQQQQSGGQQAQPEPAMNGGPSGP